MRISVIIPTQRAGSTLARSIASVRKDRYRDVELILVDNGSRGIARDTVDAVADRVDRLVRLPRNQGYAGGNNRGGEVASGDIFFLLNDDAWILPGTLAAIADAFQRDPTVAVVGCKILNEDEQTLQHVELKLSIQAFSHHVGEGELDGPQYAAPRKVNYITGAAWAIRRSLWDPLGGLSETYFPGYYEEAEFCWLARSLGWSVLFLPQARVIHRGMQTSGRFSHRYFFYYHRSRLQFLLRTGCRSEILSFLQAETGWLLTFRNWDQYPVLFLAYLWNFGMLPRTLRGKKALWAKTRQAANRAPTAPDSQAPEPGRVVSAAPQPHRPDK